MTKRQKFSCIFSLFIHCLVLVLFFKLAPTFSQRAIISPITLKFKQEKERSFQLSSLAKRPQKLKQPKSRSIKPDKKIETSLERPKNITSIKATADKSAPRLSENPNTELESLSGATEDLNLPFPDPLLDDAFLQGESATEPQSIKYYQSQRKWEWKGGEQRLIEYEPELEFPELLIEKQIPANFKASFLINSSGKAENIQILQSTGFSTLDSELIQLIRTYRFQSQEKESSAFLQFEFKLEKSF